MAGSFTSRPFPALQNRDQRIAERRNHLDLQSNLPAEQENTTVLQLVEKIAWKLQIDFDDDPSLAVLKEPNRRERERSGDSPR